MLLWVKVSSWVARPVRAWSISARDRRRRRRSRPDATGCVADVDRRRRGRGTLGAVPDRGQAVGPDPVDEQHTGVGQHLRAEVGVAAGDHRRGVDDRDDPGVDERLGGRAVHVEVVEDGDVTGAQPGQQAAGPALDAGGAQRGRAGRSRGVVVQRAS